MNESQSLSQLRSDDERWNRWPFHVRSALSSHVLIEMLENIHNMRHPVGNESDWGGLMSDIMEIPCWVWKSERKFKEPYSVLDLALSTEYAGNFRAGSWPSSRPSSRIPRAKSSENDGIIGMDRGSGWISQRCQGGNESDWGFISRNSAQIILHWRLPALLVCCPFSLLFFPFPFSISALLSNCSFGAVTADRKSVV